MAEYKNRDNLLIIIRKAVEEMQSKVRFENDGKKHLYVLKENGCCLQGVSTVSSIVPKDWLSAWGAKEAVKFLGYSDYEGDNQRALEVLESIRKMDIVCFIKLLKEAKGASARKSKSALIDGTKGHEWLESFVKAKIDRQPIPKTPLDALKRPVEQFLEWEMRNVSEWVLSEALVAYPEKGYGGTLDGMAIMKDGGLALIDFKFASHISEDYYLQTAGYSACFEAYGIKIDKRIIVRLPKTIEREEWNQKKFKYEMVPNNLEVEIINNNYELDRDAFFHALPLKKWINLVTKK